MAIQERMVRRNEIAQVFESMLYSKNPNTLIDSSYYTLWNGVDSLSKLTNIQMPKTLVRCGELMILYDKIILALNEIESGLDIFKNKLIKLNRPLSVDQFNEISGEYNSLFDILCNDSDWGKNRAINTEKMKKRISDVKPFVMAIKPILDSINVILPQANALMNEGRYEKLIQLLNKKQKTDIIGRCYSVVDSLIIEQQAVNITKAIQDNQTKTAVNLIYNLCYAKYSLNPYDWHDLRFSKASAAIKEISEEYISDQLNWASLKAWIEFQSNSKELPTTVLDENNLKTARFISDEGNVFHQGELIVPQNSKWLMLCPDKKDYSDSLVEVVLSTKKAIDPVLDEDNNPTGLQMIRDGKIPINKAYYFNNIPGLEAGHVRKARTYQLLPDYSISTIGSDEIIFSSINQHGMVNPILIRGSDTLDVQIGHSDGLTIEWIGDINNDGLIDIIVDAYPHYNNSVQAILFSTRIDGKIKFKLFATHSTTGC